MGNSIRFYSDSRAPKKHHVDWMKNIPDYQKFSNMTIPGTHDSCALYGICCARAQSWTIPEQLKAGLRYFDVRMRRIDDTLRAFHGFVAQKEELNVVLNHFTSFLDEHPSEAIIVQLVDEYDVKNCTKSFEDMYYEYTKDIRDRIVEYDYKDITLGQIRGKILVVKIFTGSTSRIGGFNIQNSWSVNFRCYMSKKKRKIKTQFNRATNLNDGNTIFLNFLSASSDYAMMTPYVAAKQCNELTQNYRGRLGIVLSDYPGEELIEHIINQNFQQNSSDEEGQEKKDRISTEQALEPTDRTEDKYSQERNYIKSGDKVCIIHNDTQKYLTYDKSHKELFYCGKEPKNYIIRHKEENIERDTFKSGDSIILYSPENEDNFEIKITKVFSEQNEDLKEYCFFVIQIFKDEKLSYISTAYENKVKKKCLLNYQDNPSNEFEFFFTITLAK